MAALEETIDGLLACVVTALEEADRPVCDSGTTIGPPVIGPGQCCDCGESNGQASAFLERVYPVTGNTFDQDTRLENCRPGAVAADITIMVARCYPRINEQGDMPRLDATSVAASELNTDMAVAWAALRCCGQLAIRESAVDADPEGGCSAFAIRVTSLVSVPALEGVGS